MMCVDGAESDRLAVERTDAVDAVVVVVYAHLIPIQLALRPLHE